MPSAQSPVRAGLVCALSLEAAPARHHTGLAVRVCGASGPGVAEAVEELARIGSRVIVSWGTAGGLSPRLRAGELVVPERVITRHGRGLSTDDGCREGFLKALVGRHVARSGAMLESRTMLTAPAEKQRAGREHAVVAVDMESGRVGEACAALGVPFLVIRCIVDERDDRIPRAIAENFRAGGSPRAGVLLAAVARHPADWGALGRLGMRYRRAHAALATAAEALAEHVDAIA